MNGKRKFVDENGHLWLGDGDYGQDSNGKWFVRAPGVMTGCIEKHTVVEHADKTITVSPSILVDDGRNKWHGYLEKGVWRKV